MTRHPAKFSKPILAKLARIVDAELARQGSLTILDPFAGTGLIHTLARHDPERLVRTMGVEIEPEWAKMHPGTIRADFLTWWPQDPFDMIITSPCYGNRMADHHEAKDDSRRNTYRHALGRALTDGSGAGLAWGPAYRAFHGQAWGHALDLLEPGGLFVLNVKNHIAGGEEILVSEWHLGMLTHLGLTYEEGWHVPTRGNRQGANGHLRVAGEHIYCLRKPS